MKPKPILYLTDANGIYIPKLFAESIHKHLVTGVKDEDWTILKTNPNHEFYWEVWQEVCDNAEIQDGPNGVVYTIYQDGDCWLIPKGMECDDVGRWFWPEEMV